MLKKFCYFILCIFIASCGTHRKSGIHIETKPEKRPTVSGNKYVEYQGEPWVQDISKPFGITQGLQNRHLSVWASHGKYYNQNTNKWEWQRPNLFCTNEDLYTQTIVVPYLIPMLQNAGATVFSPRERDWQKEEIIVDNDDKMLLPYYTEVDISQEWKSSSLRGFAANQDTYEDGVNPFKEGTTKVAKASKGEECEIIYMPEFRKSGNYAVYVSYATHKKSVPDAQYTVYHKGKKTVFNVNQRMGGGTWVYLGTFGFDTGCNKDNCVILSNVSKHKGVVTADAVRFGGGMGNVTRNNQKSGLPRCLEGARYYAQWAGAPDSVYRAKSGTDDYKEDIYARPYMTNWLAGGSCFAPDYDGLNVPIELSLAVHSDAGVSKDYSSIIGSLAICTTNIGGSYYPTDLDKSVSKTFANDLLNNLTRDLSSMYGSWNRRDLYDRNYAETRCPLMPSAIIETLSHQNFPDMRLGQDPNFRFTLARSIYKTILKFVSKQSGKQYTVSPLPPVNIKAELCSQDTLLLSWDKQDDYTETSAYPKQYVLYTSIGNRDYDNGIIIKGTACKVKMLPDLLYNFKVTALNDGGESFASEPVSAVFHSPCAKTILVVNGFQRLSAPEVINDPDRQGFDINADPGVWQDATAGLCGSQINFDKSKLGIEGENGLGYSGNELEGLILKGNDFTYVYEHARSIMSSAKYNVVSCSRGALENNKVDLTDYDCVDLILGLQKSGTNTFKDYKTFPPNVQRLLTNFTRNGGRLLVSGAYIGSDMTSSTETKFINDILHVTLNGAKQLWGQGLIQGMSTSFNIFSTLNEEHYAATSIDELSPVNPAFCALTDYNGNSIGVAYDGSDYRSFVMGFPFECITSVKKQNTIMAGILNFLLK